MSPEYGSTCAIFPIDEETLRYLALTGRSPEQIALVEKYSKEQGLWHDPAHRAGLLGAAEPRPVDRRSLDRGSCPPSGPGSPGPCPGRNIARRWSRCSATAPSGSAPSRPTPVQLADGERFDLDHGHVVIAAITSCTNTSNPSVMVAAGLLARHAVEQGLSVKPWVKTTLAPGSKVVMEYYERAGLTPYLEKLGFSLVGYGCTTCIGNSGPLLPEISEAIAAGDLAVVSVLSGNRNFEGRISPDVRMNYLASPPLVVAYALAGCMDFDLVASPLGEDQYGQPVYLRDIWPSPADVSDGRRVVDRLRDVHRVVRDCLLPATPAGRASRFRRATPTLGMPTSTYVREPPYFEGVSMTPAL